MNIAVILGSTRQSRKGEDVARWVVDRAQGRAATYELIDLRDHPMAHFDAPVPPSQGNYQEPATIEWAATIARFDAFVFVTPEYNHSIPGVLKDALDAIYGEWNNKAAAIVSYGASGGARAGDHMRQILGELQVADVRAQLMFLLPTDWEAFTTFVPAERHGALADTMFTQLEAWAAALKPLRLPAVAS